MASAAETKKKVGRERGAADEWESIAIIVSHNPGLKARVLNTIRSLRGKKSANILEEQKAKQVDKNNENQRRK